MRKISSTSQNHRCLRSRLAAKLHTFHWRKILISDCDGLLSFQNNNWTNASETKSFLLLVNYHFSNFSAILKITVSSDVLPSVIGLGSYKNVTNKNYKQELNAYLELTRCQLMSVCPWIIPILVLELLLDRIRTDRCALYGYQRKQKYRIFCCRRFSFEEVAHILIELVIPRTWRYKEKCVFTYILLQNTYHCHGFYRIGKVGVCFSVCYNVRIDCVILANDGNPWSVNS